MCRKIKMAARFAEPTKAEIVALLENATPKNTGKATKYCSDSLVARPGGQVTGKDSLNMAAMSCSILA